MTAPIDAPMISPHPLGATLPMVYADDEMMQRLCAALDAVIAPDITLLDCFPAYLDPATAPPDLLDQLASWVGLAAARDLPLDRRRAVVARAAQLHASRGTATAIRELLQAATGFPVELDESGGSYWSRQTGAVLPGRDTPGLVIRIHTQGGRLAPRALQLLGRLIEQSVPAHLPWVLEAG